MTQEQIDRLTQYLISNGDVPAVTSQRIYEYAWGQGIRPLQENDLKPESMVHRKKHRPGDRQPGHRGRSASHHGFDIIRAMKRDVDRELDLGSIAEQLERWNAEDLWGAMR